MRSRTARRYLKLTTAILIGIAVIAVAAITIPREPAISFRRYTSPPLPDGSRYTFLYPSHLKAVQEGYNRGAGVVQSVQLLPGGWGLMPSSATNHGSITVVVGSLASMGGQIPQQRKDGYEVIGNESRHDIYLADTRSGMRLRLYHSQSLTLFSATDPAVSKSFRLLLPGELPPT